MHCADKAYIRREIKALIIWVYSFYVHILYVRLEERCYYTIHAEGKEDWESIDSTPKIVQGPDIDHPSRFDNGFSP